MYKLQPINAKGTRDFSSAELKKRFYVMEVLKKHFERFGFEPIETPAIENIETLTGKYGEEGDQLLFKVLKSGDFLNKTPDEVLKNPSAEELTKSIVDKGLRYDLTVPFARFVAQNRHAIAFPFRRYQIQPVWRADRPQKGRFREFFQCDADVVGTRSLYEEVNFIRLYDTVFSELKLKVDILINNRKILMGLTEMAGIPDKFSEFTIGLDKLDKVGKEGVEKYWLANGIGEKAIASLTQLFELPEASDAQLNALESMLENSEIGKQGLQEVRFILERLNPLNMQNSVKIDFTLARGLNYYTGCILEVKSTEVAMGSIGGGGRYDDLTGVFGLNDMPGVGISFGLDRIVLVMEELDRFPKEIAQNQGVLFLNFGEKEADKCLEIMEKWRANGVSCELYPEAAKMKKQMQYADKKGFSKVVFLGEQEMEKQELVVKDMQTGEQEAVKWE